MQGISPHNMRMTYTGFEYEYPPHQMVTLNFPGLGTITIPIPILNAYEERNVQGNALHTCHQSLTPSVYKDTFLQSSQL